MFSGGCLLLIWLPFAVLQAYTGVHRVEGAQWRWYTICDERNSRTSCLVTVLYWTLHGVGHSPTVFSMEFGDLLIERNVYADIEIGCSSVISCFGAEIGRLT